MIQINKDGTATITVDASAVKSALFAHRSIETLVPALEQAIKAETASAEKWYKAEYDAGKNDGSIFLNKEALLAAYRESPGYMTAQERHEAEEAARKELLRA